MVDVGFRVQGSGFRVQRADVRLPITDYRLHQSNVAAGEGVMAGARRWMCYEGRERVLV